ncbi:hypothetical protein CKAH01_05050 [Colletotrichum kahawae]|uniref:Uncharacterized protein n=1 Tax=Colletotrichum kahawae TaxID=34407 RepID=A0AAD9YGR0_COLKA|nr:hypothetical protein CKAH01_05050 [Colletotrichum kahawae]
MAIQRRRRLQERLSLPAAVSEKAAPLTTTEDFRPILNPVLFVDFVSREWRTSLDGSQPLNGGMHAQMLQPSTNSSGMPPVSQDYKGGRSCSIVDVMLSLNVANGRRIGTFIWSRTLVGSTPTDGWIEVEILSSERLT